MPVLPSPWRLRHALPGPRRRCWDKRRSGIQEAHAASATAKESSPFSYARATALESAVAAVAAIPMPSSWPAAPPWSSCASTSETPRWSTSPASKPCPAAARYGALSPPLIRKNYPVLSEALLSSPQLRNMASGNLMRAPAAPTSSIPATRRRLRGADHPRTVLGTSDRCIASSPATCRWRWRRSASARRRAASLADYHVAYRRRSGARDRRHGELTTAVSTGDPVVRPLPLPRCATARAALGGGGARSGRRPHPRRTRHSFSSAPCEAEQALAGARAEEGTYQKAAEAALRGARPQKDNGFKIELAKRTLARALATAAEKRYELNLLDQGGDPRTSAVGQPIDRIDGRRRPLSRALRDRAEHRSPRRRTPREREAARPIRYLDENLPLSDKRDYAGQHLVADARPRRTSTARRSRCSTSPHLPRTWGGRCSGDAPGMVKIEQTHARRDQQPDGALGDRHRKDGDKRLGGDVGTPPSPRRSASGRLIRQHRRRLRV